MVRSVGGAGGPFLPPCVEQRRLGWPSLFNQSGGERRRGRMRKGVGQGRPEKRQERGQGLGRGGGLKKMGRE